ncbi:hypothetical protein ABZP36_026066 [Zizania latifolia]
MIRRADRPEERRAESEAAGCHNSGRILRSRRDGLVPARAVNGNGAPFPSPLPPFFPSRLLLLLSLSFPAPTLSPFPYR